MIQESLSQFYQNFQAARSPRRSVDATQFANDLRATADANGAWVDAQAAFLSLLKGDEKPAVHFAGRHLAGLSAQEGFDLLTLLFTHCRPLETILLPDESLSYVPPAIAALPLHHDTIREVFSGLYESYAERNRDFYCTGTANRPFDFQIDALKDSSFCFPSPYSGRPVSNPASFLLRGRKKQSAIAYVLRDEESVFILTTDTMMGDITGIYLPDHATIICRRNPKLWTECLAKLAAFMVLFPKEASENLRFSGKRPLAIPYGIFNHIGHTVLQELEGFSQCADLGLFDEVKAVIPGGTMYFPHERLFPELASAHVISAEGELAQYQRLAQGGYLLVRPTCAIHYFSKELRQRFVRMAEQVRMPAQASDLAAADRCSPLLWIEVRTNDRYWLDQTDGIVNLIQALRQGYPNLGIVLAGWSVPGLSAPSGTDKKFIASDKEVTALITSAVGGAVPIFDITGITTPEKVVWALRIDAFIAATSSGVLFPACIANKPGVLHSCSHVQSTFIESMPDSKLSFTEDSVTHVFIDPARITDAEKFGAVGNTNYDVDWRDLYVATLSILGRNVDAATRKAATTLTYPEVGSTVAASNGASAGADNSEGERPHWETRAVMGGSSAPLPDDADATGKDQSIGFLLAVKHLASALASSRHFGAGRLSLDEWAAMTMIASTDAANLARVCRALAISRRQGREIVGALLAERLIETRVAGDEKSGFMLTSAGRERLDTVSDGLHQRIETIAGGDLRKFLRGPRALRSLSREFSSDAAAASDPDESIRGSSAL